MYRITVTTDGTTQILHHPRLFSDGYVVANPVLTEEVNTQGSLTFSVAPTNPLYDTLENRKTYVEVLDDAGHVWSGRVLYAEENIQRMKSVYCEGELAFFADSIQRPFVYDGRIADFFTQAITEHNSQVDADRRFAVGVVTVTNSNDNIYRSSEKPLTSWEFLKNKLFGSTLGGYIRTRRLDGTVYVDYISGFGHASQTVEFGENLTNLKKFVSAEDVITCLIPYGSRLNTEYTEPEPVAADNPNTIIRWGGNRLKISAVNDGKDYIKNSGGVALFGEVWGSKTWDDIKYAQTLLDTATGWLSLDAQIADKITIDAGAIDRSWLDIDAQALSVGDTVRIISKPHDINIELICTKRVIPLMNLGQSQIILGAPKKALTDAREE